MAKYQRKDDIRSIEERNQLVVGNMPLAIWCANEFCDKRKRHVHRIGSKADVIQTAFVALINAARTWRPEKGRFTTHATIAIRLQLHRHMVEGGIIPVPKHATKAGGPPKRKADVNRAFASERLPKLLATRIPERSLSAQTAEDNVFQQEAKQAIDVAMRVLTDKQRDAVVMLYGLEGEQAPLKASVIARRMGCGRINVYGLRGDAFRRLRPLLAKFNEVE